MAFSLNRAQIIGNITRDPEVRMAGASKVCTFSVATNFVWKDQSSGQRKERAEFHNVVAWRKLADICEQYLKKGRKVFVEGRLQTRDWEGQDGVKRYRTEIVAENIILLDRAGQPVAMGGAEREHGTLDRNGAMNSAPADDMAAAVPAGQ
ncbi:single-stranded DNA-binding protein, partial [Candidatus Peregrinibacteria bacterium CG11_big_fil_rev_8_21_14_0_20_46_8]